MDCMLLWLLLSFCRRIVCYLFWLLFLWRWIVCFYFGCCCLCADGLYVIYFGCCLCEDGLYVFILVVVVFVQMDCMLFILVVVFVKRDCMFLFWLLLSLCRRIVCYDDWSNIVIHVALDNAVIEEEICKCLWLLHHWLWFCCSKCFCCEGNVMKKRRHKNA